MLINSFAKINLYLDVLSKRPDGYHEIDTMFCTVDLHDSLKYALTKKPQIKILSNIPELASDENLVYKIADRIRTDFQVESGVEIYLDKKIPIAAGLGGGSSNAAVTLIALRELFQLDYDITYMHAVAAEYGSDINFFLQGGLAKGSSRGEKITLLPDLEPMELLLVNPGLAISSGEAYSLIDLREKPQSKQALWFNSLEKGVAAKYPVIGTLIKDLYLLGAEHTMMSGSGSTCIGCFQDGDKLQHARLHFEQKHYWCEIVRTIGRRQYQKCIRSLS